MKENQSDLSKNQYGFVKGRSTIDEIMRVREMIEEKQNRGLEVITVSLNIQNAFNTIEWGGNKHCAKKKKISGVSAENNTKVFK